MTQKTIEMPKRSIVIGQDISVFVRMPAKIGKRANIRKLIGLLKHYKDKYTAVELQHKSKEWRASVSGCQKG